MSRLGDWDFFTGRLINLAKNQRLAQLYILQGASSEVRKWLTERVLPQLMPQKALREQNILSLSPSGEHYKLEDLEEETWRSFFSHRPDHGHYRFIIFEYSERLSARVANRLLKDLEDTPPWISIFMINSGSGKMLATINSRAIKWRLPRASNDESEGSEEFKNWLRELGECTRSKNYGALPDLIRREEFDEKQLMNQLHDLFLASSEDISYTHCEKWLEHLQWWHKSATFHQAKWERLLPFCVFSGAKLS